MRTVYSKIARPDGTFDLASYNLPGEEITQQTYRAVNAARRWLMSEPGDETEDKMFKLALVNAGLFNDTGVIIGFICGKEDDTTVQVITECLCLTIDTLNVTAHAEPIPHE